MRNGKKSIGINAILNVIKSSLSVLFPLITFPYATRVLGVVNLGKVNYALSIEHYFALIAALGITSYAVREGSKIRNDKAKFEIFCSEIFSLNLFTTLISYVFLIILLIISAKLRSYSLLILLQSISIIFTTLAVDWINTIYEDYFLITIRSIITHIVSMVLLFVFVKSSSDYYIYAFLTVFTNIIISVSNIYYVRRFTKIKIIFSKSIFRHLNSTLIFFANNLAVSIYVNADTTMLGWMCGDYYVGIYSVAVKIYNIIKTMLAAIYIVSIPRLSFYAGNNKMEEFKPLYSKIISSLVLLLLPAVAGLMSVSDEIVNLLSGVEYEAAGTTLKILSVALMFAIFGGLVTNCLNVPLKREKVNMKATIASAVLNIVLNLYFIKVLQQNGAAITTVLSESLVIVICAITFKKWKEVADWKPIFANLFQAFVGALSIVIICGILDRLIQMPVVISLIIKVCACGVIYLIELIAFKNTTLLELFRSFKKKAHMN